jgi:iron complex outermembrane receptor protein
VLYSLVASGTISWKNELYLEIQGRQDWNSTLPPANNKYFYPGASVTWNYTDRFKINEMNRGQVRFAWADVGNGTNRYFANSQYGIGYITGTGVSAVSITPPGTLLPGALKPQRKREFEVGINNSFFKQNRLTTDFSFYTNNNYNEIINLPVSASSSSSALKINSGNLRNWGFEFSVMGSPIVTKDFRWNITVNGARQGSKVLDLYRDLTLYKYSDLINNNSGAASIRADVGQTFGNISMYDYTRDDNGNKVVTNGLYSLNSQKTITAGNINPKLYGGILSDLRYKNFNFRIGVDYKSGGTVFSYTNMRLTGTGQLGNTLQYRDESHGGLAYYVDASGNKVAWQHSSAAPPQAVGGKVYHDGLILPGTKLDATSHYVPNDVITSATSYYETYINDLASSFPPDRLFKNNYIKVREVALSYTLPSTLTNKLKLQAATITLAGRNLFYLYKSIPNVDVEAAIGADSFVENTVYPGQQTFSAGINVNF